VELPQEVGLIELEVEPVVLKLAIGQHHLPSIHGLHLLGASWSQQRQNHLLPLFQLLLPVQRLLGLFPFQILCQRWHQSEPDPERPDLDEPTHHP